VPVVHQGDGGVQIRYTRAAVRSGHSAYAMGSAAFWMSASGLYAAGRTDDLGLARTAWSVPVVLEHAARDLGH
jgi:hypothetical protein